MHIWGPLAGVLLCKSVHQALTGAPWVESYSIVWRANLMGQPLCGSAADAGCEGREAMVMAWLSSVALLSWLPGFPPPAFPIAIFSLTSPWSLSAVNSSPCPGIVLQSLHSSFQLLCLLGDVCPCPGYDGFSNNCLILIPFTLPHINCFTLSLVFLFWPKQLPWYGGWTPASIPPPAKGRSSPTDILVSRPPLVSSSYRVFHSPICFFMVVRFSCLLSYGVLQALLCSWCIHGERCTPCPPTPPPSCSPPPPTMILIFKKHFWDGFWFWEIVWVGER